MSNIAYKGKALGKSANFLFSQRLLVIALVSNIYLSTNICNSAYIRTIMAKRYFETMMEYSTQRACVLSRSVMSDSCDPVDCSHQAPLSMGFPSPIPHSVCRSIVSDFGTTWTVARQAPPSMGFSRQEYRSGLSCPPSGERGDPHTEYFTNAGLKNIPVAPLLLSRLPKHILIFSNFCSNQNVVNCTSPPSPPAFLKSLPFSIPPGSMVRAPSSRYS